MTGSGVYEYFKNNVARIPIPQSIKSSVIPNELKASKIAEFDVGQDSSSSTVEVLALCGRILSGNINPPEGCTQRQVEAIAEKASRELYCVE
jgi:hypothetical protein